jgi:hypothetical protein
VRFFFNRATGILNYRGISPPVMVAGNTARGITVTISDDGSPVLLTGDFTVTFSVRNPSIYSEEPLANTDEFAYVPGTVGDYEGVIDLSGEAMDEFMAESAQKDVVIQFTLEQPTGDTVSSIAVPAIMQNYTANPQFNGS